MIIWTAYGKKEKKGKVREDLIKFEKLFIATDKKIWVKEFFRVVAWSGENLQNRNCEMFSLSSARSLMFYFRETFHHSILPQHTPPPPWAPWSW